MNALKSIIVAATCFQAVGCWAPETFQASLAVDKARHYQFVYDGTIVYGPALGQIKERGSLTASDEQAMIQAVTELRKEPGIIRADYVGRGRFRIQFRQAGPIRAGDKLFLDLIRFSSEPQGGIRIQGVEIPPSFRSEATTLGLALDGTIRLTSEIPIVEHNAESTPWFGGLFGAYKWHVTVDQKLLPTAVLR